MIRLITFAILAIVVALGLVILLSPPGGNQSVLLYAFLLVTWVGIFDLCDRGRFANYLEKVDEEARRITWPDNVEVCHNAKIAMFLMAVLVIAFCCMGTLINSLLGISR